MDSPEKRPQMPDQREIYEVSELFKVCGDMTRMNILCALMGRELSVGDIAALLNMSASSISHQLRILKHTRLVTGRREGKSMIYRLDDMHVEEIFRIALEHINHK